MRRPGLFAHTVYLSTLTQQELQEHGRDAVGHAGTTGAWWRPGSWRPRYLGLAVRRPANTVGIFLLPLVLALIGTGHAVRQLPPVRPRQAMSYWGIVHGVMLMLGTVAAALGFAAGIMYLLQSYRLKHKLPPRPGFRLPTLEWLQQRQSPLAPAVDVSAGLGPAGRTGPERDSTVRPRRDGFLDGSGRPLVRVCCSLWLAIAMLFESLYKPAREGRKVAYITLASFVFLGLVLCLVLLGQHGISRSPGAGVPRCGRVARQASLHARLPSGWGGSR